MRFRKTIKILPGVKLNFSKSGVSTTIGKRGLSANMGKNGVYLNTGIPGTGISHREKITGDADNKAQNYELENEMIEQPENKKANSEIKDIPTLKKMRKGFRITSIILALLGIISISTIILPILFFGGMVFFLIAAWGTKNQIKELETAQAQNS